ncbi:hypothetical protein NPIL_330951 [Nephila pilipes]|uniref:Uncharacterized protein n=1 Tax=Nephila pilipes TaxID=299642 RepID=A0A8X6PZ88_NEPPI|nr:hypothetical protein NPIL_330951 [Nephila pilipes]
MKYAIEGKKLKLRQRNIYRRDLPALTVGHEGRRGSLWNAAGFIALVENQGRADGWWGEMSSANLIRRIVMTIHHEYLERRDKKCVPIKFFSVSRIEWCIVASVTKENRE